VTTAAPRKLDITSCDVEDAIIGTFTCELLSVCTEFDLFSARNILLLTLMVAQRKEVTHAHLWNVYYHLLLDQESTLVLQAHLDVLLAASTSFEDWKTSEFGGKFRFGDAWTFASVRRIWQTYAESLQKKDERQYRAAFEAAWKHTKSFKNSGFGDDATQYRPVHAASPLGVMASDEIKNAMDSWWEKGTTGPVPASADIPNPLFALTLSKHCTLPCTGDPILSYHLASACADLPRASDTDSDDGHDSSPSLAYVAAAQEHFATWSQAFVEILPREWTLRFIAADGLSLCHTLQHLLETGQLSGHFYRRQMTMDQFELDSDEYGPQSQSPKKFDVIDTSDLEDSLGTLNILVSANPLMKTVPWATLYTETRIGRVDSEKKRFEELLCGPTMTLATLLGISPVEYWTNVTAVSHVDEYVTNMSAIQAASERPGIQWRFAWKSHEHLSGQTGRSLRLKVKEETLVKLICKVYRVMFVSEDMMAFVRFAKDEQNSMLKKHSYPRYHRGSLVAFIRRLLQTVDTSHEEVCRKVLKEITQDENTMFGQKSSQAFSLEMSRHFTLPGLSQDVQRGSTGHLFSKWSIIPEAVAVTISIPARHWKRFADTALEENVPLTVEGGLRRVQGDETLWHHVFADVQVTFGTVSVTGNRQDEDFIVAVKQDTLASWSGNSDMVATFSVPAATLQADPSQIKVYLCLNAGIVQVAYFNTKLQPGSSSHGDPMIISEADLDDKDRVYISKNQPGLNGSATYSEVGSKSEHDPTKDRNSSFSVDIGDSGDIINITGRLDVTTLEGKKLLADKANVDVRKISPFIFEIVLGEREAVYQLCFPVPVVKDGSVTRVARSSAYVEVVAHVADPATSPTLDGFIFPCTLAKPGLSPSLGQAIPVPLNIPHVNLDNLPVLDVTDKGRSKFLTPLTSWTFSARERQIREKANDSGLMASTRMNFKESVFTMFMLASGLQGGQTGLFAIHHPEKGGIHMLVFVSVIRLDNANATAVLDAAVIPFTVDIIKGGRLEAFLLVLRELECCTITVDDEELVLWKKVLPALAERCRSWAHRPGCEYAAGPAGAAAVPLSTEMGRQVLCGCGAGELPENFLGLPEWDVAARFATRIAISPAYAVPFVEDVIDPDVARSSPVEGMGVQGDQTLRCRSCGALEAKGGGGLKKCMRCQKVRYCSAECQKKDWKKHRMECGEAGGR
jgi:hypothetical protein